MIAHGVCIGFCGLTQHVIGIAIAFGLKRAGAFHRGFDGFAKHELPTHLFHGAPDGGADDRLAQTFDRAFQGAHQPAIAFVQHLARQKQSPG